MRRLARFVLATTFGLPIGCRSAHDPVATPQEPQRLPVEAREAAKADDPTAARERCARAIESLLSNANAMEDAARANRLVDLGKEAYELGDLPRSKQAWSAALEIFERTLSGDDAKLQGVRGNLAVALEALGDLEGARALKEKVVEVLSRTRTADDPDLLKAQLHLAINLLTQGDLKGSRDLFQRVLDAYERILPPDHPDLLAAEADLAVALKRLGDLRGARALEESVLAASLRTLPADHPDVLDARQNLANTLHLLGDLASARDIDEIVLAARAKELPPDHPALQEARLNLAESLGESGDLLGARKLEESVLDVFTATLPGDDPRLVEIRMNLGLTLRELGDLDGARELLEKALEVLLRTVPPDDPGLQQARNDLAGVLRELGDVAGARELQEKAVEVLSASLPEDHPDLLRNRLNLGTTLALAGDSDGALKLDEEVVAIRARTLPSDHRDLARARMNLGSVLADRGEFGRARECFEQALDPLSRTLPDDDETLMEVRDDLAWTMAHLGDAEATRRVVRSLAAGIQTLARDALLSSAPREAQARASAAAGAVATVLSLARGAGRIDPSAELDEAGFACIESLRSAALASSELVAVSAVDAEIHAMRESVLRRSQEFTRLDAEGAAKEEVESARRALEREQRGLLERLSQRPATQAFVAEPAASALAATLRPDEALVAFWRYQRREKDSSDPSRDPSVDSVLAYVVRAGASLARVELGDAAAMEAAVSRWRTSIGVAADARGLGVSAPSTLARSNPEEAGAELRRRLLDPLRPALQGARVVRVALDDVVHLVPIDALPEGEGCVGDHRRIEVRASLRECLWPERTRTGEPALLAMGGLDYDAHADTASKVPRAGGAYDRLVRSDDGANGFAALPGTLLEAEAISGLWPWGRERAAVLTGSAGTREALLELGPNARWLHVATHGWFAPTPVQHRASTASQRGISPMLLCGLALSGANGSADAAGRREGTITAEEIASVDLSRCDLAVLSACDTGIGERRAGQGVASLQTALQMAGARSAITSLWKVPDEATRELMSDFYRRLWIEKRPKAQALWEAKTHLRQMKDDRGAPRYSTRDWAAWVLTGDPN